MQLFDSTSNPWPKRRKHEFEQSETLVQLLNQLEKKNVKATVVIPDNYDLEGRFREG